MSRTIAFFHAHPDDEALLTAGTMALAADAGHRVVLVVATRGDVGAAGDVLDAGETLADRRAGELERSAAVLGVDRVAWLGYRDSGDDPAAVPAGVGAFAATPVDEAAAALADLLADEGVDVLTTYDARGGYGHPDHVQVHRVGREAARLASTSVVLEATINRDLLALGAQLATDLGHELPPQFAPAAIGSWFTPAADLTHAIDVSAVLDRKRAAMEAHASQATSADDSTRTLAAFLALPEDWFALGFGTEWYVDPAVPAGIAHHDVLATLTPS